MNPNKKINTVITGTILKRYAIQRKDRKFYRYWNHLNNQSTYTKCIEKAKMFKKKPQDPGNKGYKIIPVEIMYSFPTEIEINE